MTLLKKMCHLKTLYNELVQIKTYNFAEFFFKDESWGKKMKVKYTNSIAYLEMTNNVRCTDFVHIALFSNFS